MPGCALDDPNGREHWRRLLPVVRQADLLVLVVRDFQNDTVPAYRDRVDAKADFALVWDELIFADLETVTTRVERIELALKKPTGAHEVEKREMALLTRCREALESEAPLSSVITTDDERRQISSFGFLTEKPLVGVRNVSDDQTGIREQWDIPHVYETVALVAIDIGDQNRQRIGDQPEYRLGRRHVKHSVTELGDGSTRVRRQRRSGAIDRTPVPKKGEVFGEISGGVGG